MTTFIVPLITTFIMTILVMAGNRLEIRGLRRGYKDSSNGIVKGQKRYHQIINAV